MTKEVEINMQHNLAEFEERLQRIDLDPILYRLIVAADGPHWDVSTADRIEAWYRRYHVLFFLFPDEMIVPTKEIDEFWHFHILDTQKYLDDCTLLHGRLIHHFPYLGLRGPEDERLLKNLFQKTLDICVSTFGESPAPPSGGDGAEVVCGGGCSGKCGSRSIPSIRPKFERHNSLITLS
jgi:hypothetical protein